MSLYDLVTELLTSDKPEGIRLSGGLMLGYTPPAQSMMDSPATLALSRQWEYQTLYANYKRHMPSEQEVAIVRNVLRRQMPRVMFDTLTIDPVEHVTTGKTPYSVVRLRWYPVHASRLI